MNLSTFKKNYWAESCIETANINRLCEHAIFTQKCILCNHSRLSVWLSVTLIYFCTR